MAEKITIELVKGLPAPESGNRIVYDTEQKGFGIRATAAGVKSFVLNYRSKLGRERRLTIGQFPAWTVTAARAEAKKLRQAIDSGADPVAEGRTTRGAEKARKTAETFAEAVADYIAREQKGRRQNVTADEIERTLLKACEGWNSRPVAEITARDVRRVLEAIRDGDGTSKPRPYLANRTHAYLATFFGWCAEPGVERLPESPMRKLKRPFEGERKRKRFFDDDELRALWRAADAIGGTAGAYLKCQMLTGKRSGQLAAMRWSEVDANGLWTPAPPPKENFKKRRHAIPLPRLVRAVIAPLRSLDGDGYVFTGSRRGVHLDPGSPLQSRIKALSGVADFFYHACKHTAETRMAELGVLPHIRDMVLDHAPGRGAGAGYDHFHYGPEMLDALERWAGHIERLVVPEGVAVLR